MFNHYKQNGYVTFLGLPNLQAHPFIALIRSMGELLYNSSGVIVKYLDFGRIRREWAWGARNSTILGVGGGADKSGHRPKMHAAYQLMLTWVAIFGLLW